MPQHIMLNWNSPEGKKRLLESRHARAFFKLAHCYQPQINPSYCGIASAVILLNAFRAGLPFKINPRLALELPEAQGGGRIDYNAYSQSTFLDRQSEKIKAKRTIKGGFNKACPEGGGFDPGLTLKELAAKMRLHLLRVRTQPAEGRGHLAVERFRCDVMAFVNDPEMFLIANFSWGALGKKGGGHFSPLAAYHERSDSCLVLDVAGHKHPWFWVSVSDLYRAMHTKDGKEWRGWLIVSDKLREG